MVQLCHSNCTKKGPAKTGDQINTRDIPIMATVQEEDITWWGLVENDEIALEMTGKISNI